MFAEEINNLRNFTRFCIEYLHLEKVEPGLIEELYDTTNDQLHTLTVHVLSLTTKDQLDEINRRWVARGKELPDLYFGGEDE